MDPCLAETLQAISSHSAYYAHMHLRINTLRPRQNGRHFADDTFKHIFLNENVWISLKIPLKFAPRGQINNIPALIQIMAWRRPGDKPLSEPMLVFVLMHICVTQPQWVNYIPNCSKCFLAEIICSAPNTSSMFCYVLVWFSINISQWNQIIHLTPFESIMTLLTMEYLHNSPISNAVMLKDVCKTYIYTNLHNVHNHWDIL